MNKLDTGGVISSHTVDYAMRMVRDGDEKLIN